MAEPLLTSVGATSMTGPLAVERDTRISKDKLRSRERRCPDRCPERATPIS